MRGRNRNGRPPAPPTFSRKTSQRSIGTRVAPIANMMITIHATLKSVSISSGTTPPGAHFTAAVITAAAQVVVGKEERSTVHSLRPTHASFTTLRTVSGAPKQLVTLLAAAATAAISASSPARSSQSAPHLAERALPQLAAMTDSINSPWPPHEKRKSPVDAAPHTERSHVRKEEIAAARGRSKSSRNNRMVT